MLLAFSQICHLTQGSVKHSFNSPLACHVKFITIPQFLPRPTFPFPVRKEKRKKPCMSEKHATGAVHSVQLLEGTEGTMMTLNKISKFS